MDAARLSIAPDAVLAERERLTNDLIDCEIALGDVAQGAIVLLEYRAARSCYRDVRARLARFDSQHPELFIVAEADDR
jgi:hypothetical protein